MCPAPRRPSSPARSPAASTGPFPRGSSARPTSSRPTSPGSRSSTRSARQFEFQPGPVFANVLLVDEINRAMPKTQSALLEAMAERQVTVDGDHARAARAVLPDGDGEPDRVRGDVPAPRGTARPVRAPLEPRLPGARRRSCRSCASSVTGIRSTGSHRSCRSRRSGSSAAPARTSTSTSSSTAGSSGSFGSTRDARGDRGRSLRPRVARAGQGRPRLGAPPRPRLREARRRRGAVRSRARAPAHADADATSPRRGNRTAR